MHFSKHVIALLHLKAGADLCLTNYIFSYSVNSTCLNNSDAIIHFLSLKFIIFQLKIFIQEKKMFLLSRKVDLFIIYNVIELFFFYLL